MSSIVSVVKFSSKPWTAGQEKVRWEVTLMDNFAAQHTEVIGPLTRSITDNGQADAAALLQSKKDAELGPEDKVPAWNDTQAEYDRRSLGRAMLIDDVDDFYAYLPLFKAMESRGGANAGQRASYLGVLSTDYNLMANRFGDVEGVAFFLDDRKGQIWDELPPEFN